MVLLNSVVTNNKKKGEPGLVGQLAQPLEDGFQRGRHLEVQGEV